MLLFASLSIIDTFKKTIMSPIHICWYFWYYSSQILTVVYFIPKSEIILNISYSYKSMLVHLLYLDQISISKISLFLENTWETNQEYMNTAIMTLLCSKGFFMR